MQNNTANKHLSKLTLGQLMQRCDPKLARIPKQVLEEGMLRHYFGDRVIPAKQRILKRAVEIVCKGPIYNYNYIVNLQKAKDYVSIMNETDSDSILRALVMLNEFDGQVQEGRPLKGYISSTVEHFEARLKELGTEVLIPKSPISATKEHLPIDTDEPKHSPLVGALRKGIREGYKQTAIEIEAEGGSITSTEFEVKMAEAGAKISGQKPAPEEPKRKSAFLEGLRKGYRRKVKEMKESGAADNTEVLVAEMSNIAIPHPRKPAFEERLIDVITRSAPVFGAVKKAALVLTLLGISAVGSYSIYQSYHSPPKMKQEDTVNIEEQRKQALYSRTMRFLRSSDPIARQRAITDIEQRKDKRYVRPLVMAVFDEEDPEIKKFGIYVLGELGDPKAIQELAIALKDENIKVSVEAAKALGKIGHFSAIPELVGAFFDIRPDVRYSAAEAIGLIAEKAEDRSIVQPSVEPLKKLLNDKDPAVRYAAGEALRKIKSY